MLKRIGIIIAFSLLTSISYGQNLVNLIGATVDSDSQPWASASWSAHLQVPGGGQAHFISGGVVPNVENGFFDTLGKPLTGETLPNNSQIVPTGTAWKVTVCSLTSAPCQVFTFPVTDQGGGNFDFGLKLSTLVTAPRINGAPLVYAYNTKEIVNQVQGNGYTNTISNQSFLWNGQAWVSAGGSNCPEGNCIIHAPTSNQSVQQPVNTSLEFLTNNVPTGHTVFQDTDGSALGFSASSGVYRNFRPVVQSHGAGFNNGNDGSPSPGWKTVLGTENDMEIDTSGIAQSMHFEDQVHAVGDKAHIYMGNSLGWYAGGCYSTSDECNTGININGTQYKTWFHGTVVSTTGTGDRAVVVSNGALINGGYVIDASKPIQSGNLAGFASLWESNPFGISQIPVTGPTVPTTSICITATGVPASTDHLTPHSETVTCTVHDSLPLPTGPINQIAWITAAYAPERITLVSATAPSGNSQSVTFMTINSHAAGAYIFLGGDQGTMQYDDNLLKAGEETDILVFGSTSPGTEIVGLASPQGMNMVHSPYLGLEAQTSTSGYHIFPAAMVISLQPGGITPILAQNNVPFAVGDTIFAPPPTSYRETGYAFNSTQMTHENPHDTGALVELQWTGAQGANGIHPAMIAYNETPSTTYLDYGGWLDGPPMLDFTGRSGNTLGGMMGPLAIFNDPLVSRCGNVNVILCNRNTRRATTDTYIYFDQTVTGGTFGLRRSSNHFFFNLPIATPGLQVNGQATAFTGLFADSISLRDYQSAPAHAYQCLSFSGSCADGGLVGDVGYQHPSMGVDPSLYRRVLAAGKIYNQIWNGTTYIDGGTFDINGFHASAIDAVAYSTIGHLTSFSTATGRLSDSGIPATNIPTYTNPVANKAVCIKVVGPPVQLGVCSTAIDATGGCTCN